MRRLFALTTAAVLLCALAPRVSRGDEAPPAAPADQDVGTRGFSLPSVPPPPPPSMHGLTIRTVGDGSGKVPLPPAAACPPTCAAQYPQGTPIMLTPVPAPGSVFAGWGGDCRGAGPCSLRMDRPYTVEAKFNKLQTTSSPAPSFPDVTKTPSPGGPIPIPYPNVGGASLGPELMTISTMMGDGKPANTVLDAWKGYVTRRVQSRQPLDVPGTVRQIQSQAEAQVKARTETRLKRLSAELNSMEQKDQRANTEMQNVQQQQQQALQTISNLAKAMHDTAMAIIGKSGG